MDKNVVGKFFSHPGHSGAGTLWANKALGGGGGGQALFVINGLPPPPPKVVKPWLPKFPPQNTTSKYFLLPVVVTNILSENSFLLS